MRRPSPSTYVEVPMLVHPAKSGVRMLVLASLLATLGPATAGAADSAEAKAVIAKYLQATGRRADRERSTHAKGTVSAFGLSGTFEQWTLRPDRLAAVTTIGPFTLREGADSSGAWRVDQNGKLA